jgi:hypothetical protein
MPIPERRMPSGPSGRRTETARSGVVVALLLGLASVAHAQATWVLTWADFRSERVTLESIDAGHVTVSANSDRKQVALDRLLMLERVGVTVMPAGRFVAVLAGNDRACGQPKSVEGENLIWTHPTLGELTLPLKSVLCIVRADQTPPLNPPPQTEDIVTLNNGDSVRGIIAALSDSSVTVQQAGGEAIDVPLDSATRVASPALPWRVRRWCMDTASA